MSPESGFCLIHRSLIGHPDFRNDGEAMAFAWLVLRASWKPSKVRYKGRSITLERGQLALSIRDFAAAIDRPKGWVERLLKRLENGTSIRTSDETGVSVITICNYDKYQAPRDTGRTAGETPSETDAGHRTNKGTNISEAKASSITINDDEFERFWSDYPRKVGKGAARKAYKAARKKTDHETIVGSLRVQRGWGVWDDPAFAPHAATWLNGERWLDEPGGRKNPAAGSASNRNGREPVSMVEIARRRAAARGAADLSGDGWIPAGSDGVQIRRADG